MIYVKTDENNKAKVELDGNLGVIYAEIALVVKLISDNKELEMTPDEVLEMISESIEYGDIPNIQPALNQLTDGEEADHDPFGMMERSKY